MPREPVTMEEDMKTAEDLLRTIIHFLEHGNVELVLEREVINYFKMCRQIEIYYEKFKCKGYYMSMDENTGVFSLSRSNTNRSKYDLNKIADKLFEKFCLPSSPSGVLYEALVVFSEECGATRLKEFMDSVIYRASSGAGPVDAPLLMAECELKISEPMIGIEKVKDLLTEVISDDECSDTIVNLFAIENDLDRKACCEIKKIMLDLLREKLENSPCSRLWILILESTFLIYSVDIHGPFFQFILDMIKLLSDKIICVDSEMKKFYSPPGTLSYHALVRVITTLYRNRNSRQKIINFIFTQCGVNPGVWHSVMNSCHNVTAANQSADPL